MAAVYCFRDYEEANFIGYPPGHPEAFVRPIVFRVVTMLTQLCMVEQSPAQLERSHCHAAGA
jgi:hypothetical protein